MNLLKTYRRQATQSSMTTVNSTTFHTSQRSSSQQQINNIYTLQQNTQLPRHVGHSPSAVNRHVDDTNSVTSPYSENSNTTEDHDVFTLVTMDNSNVFPKYPSN